MHSKTGYWFEVSVRYERMLDDGTNKKVTETYVTEAMSFAEVEKRIMNEVGKLVRGGLEVKKITPATYKEVVFSGNAADEHWFKAKVSFITLDEKSGKDFSTHITTVADEDAGIAKVGQLVVTDKAENGQRFVSNMEPFDYGKLSSVLGIGKPDMKAFLDSLKDKNDMKSGNYELLPADSFSERLYREMSEQGIDPTEKNKIGKQFVPALYRDLQAFHSPGGSIIYEPCDQRFKDYNDLLLNRPMLEQKPFGQKANGI